MARPTKKSIDQLRSNVVIFGISVLIVMKYYVPEFMLVASRLVVPCFNPILLTAPSNIPRRPSAPISWIVSKV